MADAVSAEIVALTSRDLDVDVAPLTDREAAPIVSRALEAATGVPAVVEDAGSGISGETRRKAADRLEFLGEAAELLVAYANAGIWCLTPFDEGWPTRLSDRLQARAPVVLYGIGDPSLLTVDGIGVVGSRNLSSEGEAVAKSIGREAARAKLPAISGAARGADRIGMESSMSAGGKAVGVLAHPLGKTASEHSVAEYIESEALCLVTQFKPSAGFSVGAAMARNKVIYGLSRRTVVVASDKESGGTWAGATEAIRARPESVAVWRGSGEGPGNALLIGLGATAISRPDQCIEVAEPSGQLPLLG